MARHVFVIDTEGEPRTNWMNPWNLVLSLAYGAPGGRPYEAAEITEQLPAEVLAKCLADTKQKTGRFKD